MQIEDDLGLSNQDKVLKHFLKASRRHYKTIEIIKRHYRRKARETLEIENAPSNLWQKGKTMSQIQIANLIS